MVTFYIVQYNNIVITPLFSTSLIFLNIDNYYFPFECENLLEWACIGSLHCILIPTLKARIHLQ